ncbi:MAG: DsbE family thiol:disulfide interchange protein [Gammaproteobacteria bacterium]|nr:DsbE family thiol:disulfide interchange protein [Gammaproteobacteria bacterium]
MTIQKNAAKKTFNKKRLLMVLPMLVAFALGMFLFQGIGQDPNKMESSLIGRALPQFTAKTLASPATQVSQNDMIGAPALINVWATWCPTCRAEHEFLNRIAAQEGVKIFGVNYHDQRNAAQQWLQDLGSPYVFTVFDPKGALGIELGVVGAPETYLIDAQGIVVDKLTGELNDRTWPPLREQYLSLLQGTN